MLCPHCKAEVGPGNGFCPQCGSNLNAKLCPNGHVMNLSWDVCPYCPPGAQAGSKGGTMAEGGGGGSKKGRTVVEPGGGGVKSFTAPEGLLGTGDRKGKTIIDRAPGAGSAPSGPKLVGWMVSFTWNAAGQDFKIREGRNVIGAGAGQVDILIAQDPNVSGIHAVLIYREGRFLLGDEHSTNGTFVNGKDISEVKLQEIKDNDLIRVGTTEFKLKAL